MERQTDFTTGKIVAPLLKFAIPVLIALFLQSLYGAVDLLIVGQFSEASDVSAVSTGSQIMMTITNLIASLCMGMTIFLGQKIGEKKADEGGRIIGSGLVMFMSVGLALTISIPFFSKNLAAIMHAPTEAFDLTSAYIKICGTGIIVIIAYNLIGGIFRGLGDSNTPLVTVLIACIFNIIGDLVLVAVFNMGTKGAAIATVLAQLVSVLISLLLISKKKLPFEFNLKMLRWDRKIIGKILFLGTPIAVQDLLVGISFLVILAIVNALGLTASAGVGVAEKVCAFIMLVPAAFMQSMSAFVAQNRGAGRIDRAIKGLKSAVAISFIFGFTMFYTAFFHGDLLAGIFSNDEVVILAAADYLKAYAIDCLLTCFLFCFVGFYNGMEYTRFVMVQGIIGAFAVRVPVSFIMSRWEPVSLFHIGLATPCSTMLQITLCFGCYFYMMRKLGRK
ncbi:MAG: MATE family efflux transporter [Butyrivibrio sp.]|uniref:MATE family efflux transporter n=1 Tax=Butyrivibrio sp. TaxID=28121 RepID=UPI0025D919B3|nr:MATE family efflux transporter [Butyrivibrio sp.]MCR5770001.1 MATE family efflux transporter [Butyrivibrio sp.]